MASVASMLARVRRLEAARAAPVSPLVQMYGSFEVFEAEVQADIDAGKLERIGMTDVLACLRRWERDGRWGLWRRDRLWEYGGK